MQFLLVFIWTLNWAEEHCYSFILKPLAHSVTSQAHHFLDTRLVLMNTNVSGDEHIYLVQESYLSLVQYPDFPNRLDYLPECKCRTNHEIV